MAKHQNILFLGIDLFVAKVTQIVVCWFQQQNWMKAAWTLLKLYKTTFSSSLDEFYETIHDPSI